QKLFVASFLRVLRFRRPVLPSPDRLLPTAVVETWHGERTDGATGADVPQVVAGPARPPRRRRAPARGSGGRGPDRARRAEQLPVRRARRRDRDRAPGRRP